ncbi:hypothetical protein NQ318_017414 [Aromia moschata]|uniref:PH domain-containing protein n=1 Tax=Aromia moschata TaxID=1265417 RepID=A0AAV8Z300_9CUCU|nr:hypothetical protein NQ318_017414 [Aromia moschata]
MNEFVKLSGRSVRLLGHSIKKQVLRKMGTTKPIQESITNKLKENLAPVHLDVINESYMHNVPKGAETHFKVVVISDKFDGLPLIKFISLHQTQIEMKRWVKETQQMAELLAGELCTCKMCVIPDEVWLELGLLELPELIPISEAMKMWGDDIIDKIAVARSEAQKSTTTLAVPHPPAPRITHILLIILFKHRMVNEALKFELQNGVHALSIVAETPSQWQQGDKQIDSSPACRGVLVNN